MVSDLTIKVDPHGLDKKLESHADQIAPELARRVNDMLLTVENNVKFVTHRGQHCNEKGGRTKSAIRHLLNNNGGMVYVDEGIAPWAKWYIDGRGPVEAKNVKALRFCVEGELVYTKRVKAWKGHNIMKEGLERSTPILNQKIDSLGKWLSTI